jgi:hypothetical protein
MTWNGVMETGNSPTERAPWMWRTRRLATTMARVGLNRNDRLRAGLEGGPTECTTGRPTNIDKIGEPCQEVAFLAGSAGGIWSGHSKIRRN